MKVQTKLILGFLIIYLLFGLAVSFSLKIPHAKKMMGS